MSKFSPAPWRYLQAREDGDTAFISNANGIILGEVKLTIAPLVVASPRMLALLKSAKELIEKSYNAVPGGWLDGAGKLIAEIEGKP